MDFHKINRRCIARKIQVNAIGANALSVFEHLPHHIDEANAFDALSLNGHRALGGILRFCEMALAASLPVKAPKMFDKSILIAFIWLIELQN